MDAELKIVGAIVIVVLFLANTGVGIWIYKIMKASEKVVEVDKSVVALSDKFISEREQRIKYELKLEQIEKEFGILIGKHNEMYKEFIDTTRDFQAIAAKLNTTMENINGHISGIQSDIREIRGQVGK